MNVATISEFRKDIKKYIDQVIDDQNILIVARNGGRSVVLLPLDMYDSMNKLDNSKQNVKESPISK